MKTIWIFAMAAALRPVVSEQVLAIILVMIIIAFWEQ